jgi:hypothetical protein
MSYQEKRQRRAAIGYTRTSSAAIDQLFTSSGTRIAISSGDGVSHPDADVIRLLEDRKIDPYCTNLIAVCGANIQNLMSMPNLDPELARWVREVCSNSLRSQPCQGDVTVKIGDDAQLSVSTEHANACGFRGDFDNLFQGVI